MCGICGLVQSSGAPLEMSLLRAMNATLTHRGPDADGYFCDDGVGLAMRRLRIIDTGGSEQPLSNEDGSVQLIFNGEIYNYQALRQTLTARGHRLRTAGDGETIAHLYEDHGVACLHHLRGQFALALWDQRERRLLLARDRLGQKPLYVYQDEGRLFFGSEIKAILAHPDVKVASALDDPRVLALYLGYGYLPAPLTAYEGVRALMPGQYLLWEDGAIHTQTYWTPPTISDATTGELTPEVIDATRATLDEAVRLRLLADVPLGAFLSGGLDSSLLVALMQRHSDQPVKTFSIGFAGDDSFDETPYAQEVAALLGTEHQTFTLAPDVLELLPRLLGYLDQPFADSSVIPTYLVSQQTRQHVTVALTGDGGDELFAGYERFVAARMVQQLSIMPRPLWRTLAGALGALPEGTGYYNLVKRARRFAQGAAQPLTLAYFDWVRLFDADQIAALIDTQDHAGEHFSALFKRDAPPTLADILYANMTGYLPDDLLIKADRMSMAVSLEARAPFLDHVLVEKVNPLALNLKLKGRTTKHLLKAVARGWLPDAIIDRRKHGFGAPMGAWLRRDMALVRDVLLDESARRRAQLAPEAVTRLIDEHASGQRDHGFRLWALLALILWQGE